MITVFPTPEDAALFAAARRDAGYFAEVCDDCSARFWGPLAVGGCRVISSESRGHHREKLRDPGPTIVFLFWVVRFWGFVFLVAGLPALLVLGARVVDRIGVSQATLLIALSLATLAIQIPLSLLCIGGIRRWRLAMAGYRVPLGHHLVFVGVVIGYGAAFLVLFSAV